MSPRLILPATLLLLCLSIAALHYHTLHIAHIYIFRIADRSIYIDLRPGGIQFQIFKSRSNSINSFHHLAESSALYLGNWRGFQSRAKTFIHFAGLEYVGGQPSFASYHALVIPSWLPITVALIPALILLRRHLRTHLHGPGFPVSQSACANPQSEINDSMPR